jgi:hypothetical protein
MISLRTNSFLVRWVGGFKAQRVDSGQNSQAMTHHVDAPRIGSMAERAGFSIIPLAFPVRLPALPASPVRALHNTLSKGMTR